MDRNEVTAILEAAVTQAVRGGAKPEDVVIALASLLTRTARVTADVLTEAGYEADTATIVERALEEAQSPGLRVVE